MLWFQDLCTLCWSSSSFSLIIEMACCPLVQHYGKEVVAKELGLPLDHPNVQTVYLAVYKNFLEVRRTLLPQWNGYSSSMRPPNLRTRIHSFDNTGVRLYHNQLCPSFVWIL